MEEGRIGGTGMICDGGGVVVVVVVVVVEVEVSTGSGSGSGSGSGTASGRESALNFSMKDVTQWVVFGKGAPCGS